MEHLEDDERWFRGNISTLRMRLEKVATMDVEEFQRFILEENIPETCATIQLLDPENRMIVNDEEPCPFNHFIIYLSAVILCRLPKDRSDALKSLMQYKLPFCLYLNTRCGFRQWIAESLLDIFELFLAQGYKIQDLRGHVEKDLAKFGNIDVLDFILEKETGEEHILDPSIVYHTCKYKNVDMLDRLAAKNYSANERIVIRKFFLGPISHLPLSVSFDKKYKSTAILDRLIMLGADPNLVNKDVPWSLLISAHRCEAPECFQRLLDIGARVINEVDNIAYFLQAPTREGLIQLVKAGMDLNYQTPYGSALTFTQFILPETKEKEEIIDTIRQLGGK